MDIATSCAIPQATYIPSHPKDVEVKFSPGDFMSSLHARKTFEPGAKLCNLGGCIPATRTRLSFQGGDDEHFEFNSDVVFANHSCGPNAALDLSSTNRDEWYLVAVRNIAAGDEITWFYPSTEWDAWGGGFACCCNSEPCIKDYRGSKYISLKSLSQYPYISPHVMRLATARDRARIVLNGHTKSLRIAYAFDRASDYRALGYTEEECAEFDSDLTIDCVAASLSLLGTVEMVGNFRSLLSRLVNGGYKEWDIVFNYTEGISGVGREAQSPLILEAYGVPFTLSDAATQVICLDKCKTKMVLQFHGIPTAPFAVVPGIPQGVAVPANHAASAVERSPQHTLLTFPLFAKPAAEGSSKGILPTSKIDTHDNLEASVNKLLTRFPDQDVIVECYLAGREFNVGILGTGSSAKVIGVIEYVFKKTTTESGPDALDFLSYDLKNASDQFKPQFLNCNLNDPIIKAVADVGLRAWVTMGCYDAGSVDIRHDVRGDAAVPYVLEVNTIPGLTPDRAVFPVCARANGITFDELIAEMLHGALRRIRK